MYYYWQTIYYASWKGYFIPKTCSRRECVQVESNGIVSWILPSESHLGKPTLNKRKKNWCGTSSKIYPIRATQRFCMSTSIMDRRWSPSRLFEHHAQISFFLLPIFSFVLFNESFNDKLKKEFSSLYILRVKVIKFWWDRRETDSRIFLIREYYHTAYYIRKIDFRLSLCFDKGIRQDLCSTVLISNSKHINTWRSFQNVLSLTRAIGAGSVL